MAVDHMAEKRARLLASKCRWTGANEIGASQLLMSPSGREKSHQDSIQRWLISITEEDDTPEVVQDAPVQPLKRTASAEDDLALGIEASLYGKPTVRTAQGLLRSSIARPPLARWNSLTSAFSTHSGALSVMDVLNLWQDDPEELLLDLGFGAEEPDITVRIPARFINHQSKARGINIQLFLEAQKNRMDIENPDVRNRFRQLEVLQQVTTAFNSLVGGSASVVEKPGEAQVSEETKERRKRVGMLLRKASKKSLSQAGSAQDHQPLSPKLTGPFSSPDLPSEPQQDKRSPVKRARQCLPESASLSPLVEEQISVPEPAGPIITTPLPQCKSNSPRAAIKPHNTASTQRNPGEPAESFELEEIQSFDEGSLAGSCTGITEHSVFCVRTNSCQSDSSGFLEEPFIPAFLQHRDPRPVLIKGLNAMSGDSTDNQQKCVEQQETEFCPPGLQSTSECLLDQTKSCNLHSGIDSVKEPTQNKPLMSDQDAPETSSQETSQVDMNDPEDCVEEGTTSQDIVGLGNLEHENIVHEDISEESMRESTSPQDTGQVDCLADLNVAQKDITEDCVGESNTSQTSGHVDCFVNVNIVQKDITKDCIKESDISQEMDTVQSLVDTKVAEKSIAKKSVGESTTSQEKDPVDSFVDMNALIIKDCVEESSRSQEIFQVDSLVDMTIVQEDVTKGCFRESAILHESGQVDSLVDMDFVQKDIMEDCAGERPTSQKDSPSPRPDVVPESDSQMNGLQSDSNAFNVQSSPSDITANTVASFTEPIDSDSGGLYSGRSVSVQMRSSLGFVSQSSLRGGLSPSPSLGPISHSIGQPGRESFSKRVHSDSNTDSITDPLSSLTIHAPSEQVAPSSRDLKNVQFHSLDMGTSYEEDRHWEGVLQAGAQCCCSCDHNCRCCCQNKSKKQPTSSVDQLHTASCLPFSLDELEGMMRCMRKFRRVLSEIEERLEEEQTSVLSSLSDAHRAEVQDVLGLRTAVKKEAVLLEQQLTDLVHAYDDSFKMKLNRLLDEQSQLCFQLRITPSGQPHPDHTTTRSVAIQCCLLPAIDPTDSSLSQKHSNDPALTHHREWSPSSKGDKLDFVGFIKSLKDVSISNDSLE
ncbi:protein ITPRID1 isoform X2 [Hoplias malabaricus]